MKLIVIKSRAANLGHFYYRACLSVNKNLLATFFLLRYYFNKSKANLQGAMDELHGLLQKSLGEPVRKVKKSV